MTRKEIVEALRAHRIIAIIRADRGGDALLHVVDALARGGVHAIEVTMTTPGALEAIEGAARRFSSSGVLLGAGTILTAEDVSRAVGAGAEYLVAPICDAASIEAAHALGKPILPGALTPNEIYSAWRAGGDLIKVFPATLGGLDYIKAVRAPLPQIPLVPTGGVDQSNLHDFLRAGVAAVGIGTSLAPKALVEDEDYEGIRRLAEGFVRRMNA